VIAKVSLKGQMVIPEAIREQARISPGDEVEIGYTNGLIVLRKRRTLTPACVRSLLRTGSNLPRLSPKDEDAVADTVQRVRRRAR
jgi:AbrB family looped-hinge helix DNA binding protein